MKNLGPKALETFRLKTIERISALSNRELYNMTFGLAAGDDYDGCFTQTGRIEYDVLRTELEMRLHSWLED